ncbi:phage major capsid protein [Kocuria sp. SM24M-10]|uniref:phage major capsid protein n=1 Tax=Kocuria sp. SM24M-10 TaxID=1660349 RepID=UPI000699F073|nr:phage major capsid protein [Kocuria sp. SM24M-10]
MRKYSTILTELRPVLADVKGGDCDPEKVARLRALTTEAAEAKSREQAEGDELLATLNAGVAASGAASSEGKRLTRAGLKSTARKLGENLKHGAAEQKAAVSMGAYTAPIQLTEPATMGTPPQGFVEALGVDVFPDRFFSFLKQTSRALNAGVVPEGQLKPTSSIGLERVQGETQVIAHVSEPISEQLLADVASVSAVVGNELMFGLYQALEQQVLYGTGAGELHGVLVQDGVQVVSTGTRPVDRLRNALTALQMQGYTAGLIALNPSDWAGIELATTGTNGAGDYMLGGPVDSAAQKLWGTQVVLTTALTVGEAVVLDPKQLGIASTGNINLHVGQPGDAFTRNQVVFRCEGRFETMLRQPAAVARVALTDPAA